MFPRRGTTMLMGLSIHYKAPTSRRIYAVMREPRPSVQWTATNVPHLGGENVA